MNKAHIRDLIHALRYGLPHVHYDQRVWLGGDPHNECDTVACLAGHAVLLMERDNQENYIKRTLPLMNSVGTRVYIASSIRDRAEAFLDLTRRQAEEMFRFSPAYHQPITAEQAARMLENLLATGEVDWRAAVEPPREPAEEEDDEPLEPDEGDEPLEPEEDEDYDDEFIPLREHA
jgi:hypothetical protein